MDDGNYRGISGISHLITAKIKTIYRKMGKEIHLSLHTRFKYTFHIIFDMTILVMVTLRLEIYVSNPLM